MPSYQMRGRAPTEEDPATNTDTNEAGKAHFTGGRGEGEGKATAEYLQACFGKAMGYVFVGLGHNIRRFPSGRYDYKPFEEIAIEWPTDTEAFAHLLIQAAQQGIDVHICPYLMREKKRSKGGAVERWKVHADLDKPENINQDRLLSLIGHIYFAESGSPYHYHVYCLLTRSVPQPHHEALCRGLGAYIGGADVAKCSDNDYLRPPGTLNRKPTVDGGQPNPVTLVIAPHQATPLDPEELARILGVDLNAPVGVAVASNGEDPDHGQPVNLLALHSGIRKALETRTIRLDGTPDRSVDGYRVLCACHDAGLTLAQAESVLRQRGGLAEWLDENPPNELDKTWAKIHADRQQRAAQGAADGPESPTPQYCDIAAMLDGTLPEPPKPQILARQDGHCLLYKGRVNILFGDPEEGKTWIAWAACAETLKKGEKVAILDFDHNGPQATAAGLLALGAPYDALRDLDRFRYIEPEDRTETLLVVADIKGDWKPDMVLADSMTELLVLLGKSSNSGDEYLEAHRMVLQPLANAGAAMVAIDHPAKNLASRTMGPTGSSAKRQAVGGVSLRVRHSRQFIPGKGGSAGLYINKDLHGGVRAHCPPSEGKGEQRAGTFVMDPPDVGGGMSWRVLTPMRHYDGLTEEQTQYLHAAREKGEAGFTVKEIAVYFTQNDPPTSAQVEGARRACEFLKERSLLECNPGGKGRGNATLFRVPQENHVASCEDD